MKTKPAATVSAGAAAPAPSGGDVSRRSFFNLVWALLGFAALAEMIWIALSFMRPSQPRSGTEQENAVVPAGPADSFAAGSVTAFQRGQFYLVRVESGGFLALSCKCTHLGCTVPWMEKEKQFLCPCHASAFDITGSVISAPAPRALDALPVTIANGIVKVDTSRRIKRSGFDPGQLVHPGRK